MLPSQAWQHLTLIGTKFSFCNFINFQGGPGPGSHPVILRANSPATPGTIQDTLPPALPVQRIPNPHVCNYLYPQSGDTI